MAEKLITINMRKFLIKQGRNKRLRRAAGYVRDRVAHYTKTELENVIITQALNNSIIKHYSKSMLPLKVSVKLEGGKATVSQFQEQNAKKVLSPKAKEFQKIYSKVFPKSKEPKKQQAPAQQKAGKQAKA